MPIGAPTCTIGTTRKGMAGRRCEQNRMLAAERSAQAVGQDAPQADPQQQRPSAASQIDWLSWYSTSPR